ncbi:hypothetical protein ACO0QE_001056 [Hanseniaspora vineae]
MSFLDLEKNGTQTQNTQTDNSSGIRIEELNSLVDDLDSCIIELNRGVKHVLGNKKRDNLDVRQELEKSIQEMNARISEYELTTGFQPMGKNFINKVERDLSGLIMEFEVLKGQYYKRKLMFPIYTTAKETSNSAETSDSSRESLLKGVQNTSGDHAPKEDYGTFSSQDSASKKKAQDSKQIGTTQWDAGSTTGKDATYFSIPNNGVSNDDDNNNSQVQMQLQVETDAQDQQVQQQLQRAQDRMDQQLLDEHELVVGEQEAQMNVIHDQVTEVNLIFKQLGHLIQEQGTQVDKTDVDLFFWL